MGFQSGDTLIHIKNKSFRLRLTMGALAELNFRLSVTGPQDLSLRLRALTPAEGRVLLACLMRPCLPLEADISRLAADVPGKDIARVMPAICRLFEEAFSR